MLKNKRILLTGITGNVGGYFAERLLPDNEVVALARFSREGEEERWRAKGVKTVKGDFSGSLDYVPDDCDYVIHSGANTFPRSFEDGMRDNAEGSALLLAHCRKAKAFLHVSATAVYSENPDPDHIYTETDEAGQNNMGHYGGTKLAAEGAVRAMARQFEVPAIICRLNVQYGDVSGNGTGGGLPSMQLRQLLADEVVPFPKGRSCVHSVLHNEDMFDFIEPCLDAAAIQVPTVNWGGDEFVHMQQWMDLFAELSGKPARIEYSDVFDYPTFRLDNTHRLEITGPCKVNWRDGMTRLYRSMAGAPA